MLDVQPLKALLTNQPIEIILLEDMLQALLGKPIYNENNLDEHGNMAVPPYAPPEAVFKLHHPRHIFLSQNHIFALPGLGPKASLYLAAAFENQAELILASGRSSKCSLVGDKAAPSKF
ncbi:hypothetical protein PtB15_5B739 [Puccinia triticina]|nr:hypothetical protein PtB15_5B739 [Puccinia triticina]